MSSWTRVNYSEQRSDEYAFLGHIALYLRILRLLCDDAVNVPAVITHIVLITSRRR